jgi:hypothetical protein
MAFQEIINHINAFFLGAKGFIQYFNRFSNGLMTRAAMQGIAYPPIIVILFGTATRINKSNRKVPGRGGSPEIIYPRSLISSDPRYVSMTQDNTNCRRREVFSFRAWESGR